MMNSDHAIQCRQCGACCHVDMKAYISEEDKRRWEREKRTDILSHVEDTDIRWFGDIIITGNGIQVQTCTFLNWNGKFFFCDIYNTRPHVCRDYEPGSSALCPLYPQIK